MMSKERREPRRDRSRDLDGLKRDLTLPARILKRCFDVAGSVVGLLLSGWLIGIAFVVATLETRKPGIFVQERIGRFGLPFRILKIRTMRDDPVIATTTTNSNDPRITTFGGIFRRTKIDELPQLVNVLVGEMSFVGPRPDVAGFADNLEGDDRIILSVRPGLTGPATVLFRDEERVLAGRTDPEKYNREVLWKAKVEINRRYVERYSFFEDLAIIVETIVPGSTGDYLRRRWVEGSEENQEPVGSEE